MNRMLLLMMSIMLGGEQVTLSGTSGAPSTASDVVLFPADARAGWRFNTNGTVDRLQLGAYGQFQNGVEWTNLQPSPGREYWIRITANGAVNPTSGNMVIGLWYKLSGTGSAAREFYWDETGAGTTSGSVQVDIATDSGGSNIVATGYYGGVATVDV